MLDGAQPHGEVNDVCWKLLGIAGAGFTILGAVIVVLARKLWDTMTSRLQDREATIVKIQAAKQPKSDSDLRP